MPANTTSRPNSTAGRFDHLLYLTTVAFPTWGGFISTVYMLLAVGLRGLTIRHFWSS